MEIKERIDVMQAAATLLTSLQDPFTWTLGSLSIPGLDLVEFSIKKKKVEEEEGTMSPNSEVKNKTHLDTGLFYFFTLRKYKSWG